MVMSHPSFDTSFLVDLIEVLAHRLVQRRMVILDRQDIVPTPIGKKLDVLSAVSTK